MSFYLSLYTFLVYNIVEGGVTMLKIFNTNLETGELNQLKEIKKGSWIDLVKPTEDEIAMLTDSLGIDTSFTRYILDDEEQPRIDIDEENGVNKIIYLWIFLCGMTRFVHRVYIQNKTT